MKRLLVSILRPILRASHAAREKWQRITAHAALAARLQPTLPSSVVVAGHGEVHGSGNIQIGPDVLLYPGFYFETIDQATLTIGDRCVLSRGVHITSRSTVHIGADTMIGEYTSIRDANHARTEGMPLRDSPYDALPIHIGSNVWIGRGVTVLPGVSIGDGVTVGANAVVTKSIPAGETWAGVPARSLSRP